MAEDDDCPEVVRNLRRASQKRACLNRLLIQEGLYAWTLGQIYLTVVQLVLIYGSETWVLTVRMQRVLVGFHHRVARRMTVRQLRKGRDRFWV